MTDLTKLTLVESIKHVKEKKCSAAELVRRPSTTSCASMRYQLRVISPAFGVNVRTVISLSY